MTCDELLAQFNAQIASGDNEGANATRATMLAQGCPDPLGPPGGGTGGESGGGGHGIPH